MEPSSSTHKIKPYIPREFFMSSKSSYSIFMKYKPKALSQFIFKNFNSHQHQCQKDSLRLLKAIKKLKHVHHLNLMPYRFDEMITDPPFLKSCAKRMSRTQHLSASCFENIEGSLPKSFQVWPKYIHRLKNLTIWSAKQFIQSFGEILLFKCRPREELLLYQNRLESLQITFENFHCSNNFLHFDRYPTSNKKLSFSFGVFREAEPVPSNSLDHFKNLKVLELDFPRDSSVRFINSLISLLPKIPQLESLSFFSPLKAIPELKESFRSMKALTMLKHVKIHTCHLVLPHSKVLLKVLRELPLKSLSLRVRVGNLKEVNLILKLLERLIQLETLKLQIDSDKVLGPSTLEEIFEKVDHLDNLKHLSLKVNTPNPPEKDSKETIQLPFSNLLTKQIPLESFGIESNQVNISNEAFFDLLKSLQKQAVSLKKIKLAIGEVLLDKKELKKLLKFLQNIHQEIRVLKLSMLGVYNQIHFMEIVETVQMMKYLRSFSLGKFYMQVTRAAFWKGVKKILYKRGLVKFNCDASKDFRKKILTFAKSRSGINWSMIQKKNPALIKIPDSISFNNDES